MLFAHNVYKTTLGFPQEERYGITDQMKRSSVSIASNIAEGYGRNSDNDLIRFLNIAVGSCYEVDTQIDLSHRFGFISDNQYETLTQDCEQISKMLTSLIYRRKHKLDSFEK